MNTLDSSQFIDGDASRKVRFVSSASIQGGTAGLEAGSFTVNATLSDGSRKGIAACAAQANATASA